MAILQVNIQQVGPTSGETCYRVFYDPVTKIIDSIAYNSGISTAGYPFNLFLATHWTEVQSYCADNNMVIDENANYYQNLETNH